MASVRPMEPTDLFRFASTNLDHLTETYNVGFYVEYLTKWPHLCRVIEGHDGQIEGYSAYINLCFNHTLHTVHEIPLDRPARDTAIPPKASDTDYSCPMRLHSPRQTRSLAVPTPKSSVQPRHEPGSKLPAMARTHHGADGRAPRAATGPCQPADGEPRAAGRCA